MHDKRTHTSHPIQTCLCLRACPIKCQILRSTNILSMSNKCVLHSQSRTYFPYSTTFWFIHSVSIRHNACVFRDEYKSLLSLNLMGLPLNIRLLVDNSFQPIHNCFGWNVLKNEKKTSSSHKIYMDIFTQPYIHSIYGKWNDNLSWNLFKIICLVKLSKKVFLAHEQFKLIFFRCKRNGKF